MDDVSGARTDKRTPEHGRAHKSKDLEGDLTTPPSPLDTEGDLVVLESEVLAMLEVLVNATPEPDAGVRAVGQFESFLVELGQSATARRSNQQTIARKLAENAVWTGYKGPLDVPRILEAGRQALKLYQDPPTP